ncbi:hypothetical protein ACN9MB_13335 [Dyella kyungheensis]|uniref:hypothetical protein n=1 Tax=Dyella kyungheensis TaxID=1242174 RepID=UPI003CF97A27
MCDYQGYEFGAGTYPDSYCIDGSLHDADSDYLNEEDFPCPICRREEAIAWWAERNAFSIPGGDYDEAEHASEALECATSLVDDIRLNRGIPLPTKDNNP